MAHSALRSRRSILASEAPRVEEQAGTTVRIPFLGSVNAQALSLPVLTLVLAGIIEGSFSQFSAKTVPYALKISVAVLLFVGLMTYLFLRRTDES